MPILEIGVMTLTRNKRGFTLIEILVVLLIISIAMTFVVVNFRHSLVRSNSLPFESERLEVLLSLAQTKSIMEAQVYAWQYDGVSYRFYRLIESLDQPPVWQLVQNVKLMKPYILPAPIALTVQSQLDNRIVFYPDGQVTQFILTLNSPDESRRYVCEENEGEIACQPQET